jgi:hypothetical protein
MRTSGATVPLEDHKVRRFVANDFVTQLRGEVESEARQTDQAALGIAAAERAL